MMSATGIRRHLSQFMRVVCAVMVAVVMSFKSPGNGIDSMPSVSHHPAAVQSLDLGELNDMGFTGKRLTKSNFLFSPNLVKRTEVEEELEDHYLGREKDSPVTGALRTLLEGGLTFWVLLLMYRGAKSLEGWFKRQETLDIAEEVERTGKYVDVNVGDKVKEVYDPRTGKKIELQQSPSSNDPSQQGGANPPPPPEALSTPQPPPPPPPPAGTGMDVLDDLLN